MEDNRKGLWWQILIACLMHASILLSLVEFSDDPTHVSVKGVVGSIDKKAGSADAIEAPVKISLDTGGVADARELIASRRQAQQQAQLEQERLAQEQRLQEAKQIADEQEKKEAADKAQIEKQLQREKELAAKKAKQLDGKVEKKEQEKKTAATNNPSTTNQAKTNPNTDKRTQNATNASRNQTAAANQKAQAAQKKAATQTQNTSDSINAGLKDIMGEGGGDGVRQNNTDADEFERYKAQVQSLINKNFIQNPQAFGQECRIDISIRADGKVILYQNSERGSTLVCSLGLNAINRTPKVPAPPPSILKKVSSVTLIFQVN